MSTSFVRARISRHGLHNAASTPHRLATGADALEKVAVEARRLCCGAAADARVWQTNCATLLRMAHYVEASLDEPPQSAFLTAPTVARSTIEAVVAALSTPMSPVHCQQQTSDAMDVLHVRACYSEALVGALLQYAAETHSMPPEAVREVMSPDHDATLTTADAWVAVCTLAPQQDDVARLWARFIAIAETLVPPTTRTACMAVRWCMAQFVVHHWACVRTARGDLLNVPDAVYAAAEAAMTRTIETRAMPIGGVIDTTAAWHDTQRVCAPVIDILQRGAMRGVELMRFLWHTARSGHDAQAVQFATDADAQACLRVLYELARSAYAVLTTLCGTVARCESTLDLIRMLAADLAAQSMDKTAARHEDTDHAVHRARVFLESGQLLPSRTALARLRLIAAGAAGHCAAVPPPSVAPSSSVTPPLLESPVYVHSRSVVGVDGAGLLEPMLHSPPRKRKRAAAPMRRRLLFDSSDDDGDDADDDASSDTDCVAFVPGAYESNVPGPFSLDVLMPPPFKRMRQ